MSPVGAPRNGVPVQGGPMCATDDVSRNANSFLVAEAALIEGAQRFHDADPFTKAGMFERSDVVCWDRHIGNEGQTADVPERRSEPWAC